MKALLNEIAEATEKMLEIEFQMALTEAACGELRWALEHAWNPKLCKYAMWRECFRHMWE